MAVEITSDTLALESALAQQITFAESGAITTLEARELVGAIAVEGTSLKTAPIIAALLGGRAVIVGISRAGEGTSISPAECRNLLSREASNENCCTRVLHGDRELACKNECM
jgi:hypothetical protein